jgi:hypothetical protein
MNFYTVGMRKKYHLIDIILLLEHDKSNYEETKFY